MSRLGWLHLGEGSERCLSVAGCGAVQISLRVASHCCQGQLVVGCRSVLNSVGGPVLKSVLGRLVTAGHPQEYRSVLGAKAELQQDRPRALPTGWRPILLGPGSQASGDFICKVTRVSPVHGGLVALRTFIS